MANIFGKKMLYRQLGIGVGNYDWPLQSPEIPHTLVHKWLKMGPLYLLALCIVLNAACLPAFATGSHRAELNKILRQVGNEPNLQTHMKNLLHSLP